MECGHRRYVLHIYIIAINKVIRTRNRHGFMKDFPVNHKLI